jgi:chromosome segregation ATPase
MIRKALALVGVVVVGAWLFGKFESHVKAYWNECKSRMAKQESTEFKIQRAKVLLANLEKKEKKLALELGAKRVEVEDLEKKLANNETTLKELAVSIEQQHRAYVSGKSALESELNRHLDEYQNQERIVQFLKDTVEKQKKVLQTMEDDFDKFTMKRSQLAAELDQVKSRLELAKAQEILDRYQEEGRELTEAEAIIQDVTRDVRIEEYANKKLNKDVSPSSPASKATPSVTERFKTLFEKKSGTDVTVAEK